MEQSDEEYFQSLLNGDQSDPEVQFQIALCYYEGTGVEADPAYCLALADGVWTVSREGEETALQSGVYDVDGAGTLCFRPREGEDPSFVGRVEGDGLILCSNGANLRCPRIA